MLLRHLEYLVALARERHFARAAASCHVSQPSLSAGIRRLEAELKVTIVDRGRRFVGLTPEGEVVLAWARRILADRDGLAAELAVGRDGLSGTVRIGVIPTAVATLDALTEPFCDRHPAVRIAIETASAPAIRRGLTEFDLDVGVTYVDDPPGAGIRADPLYRERYVLLVPDDDPLAAVGDVDWADLAGRPLCLLGPAMRNRRILDELAARAGVEIEARLEADTVAALWSHVATRQWSSVIAHPWLRRFGLPGGVRALTLPSSDGLGAVGLLRSARRPEPILARAFADVAATTDLQAVFDAALADVVGGG